MVLQYLTPCCLTVLTLTITKNLDRPAPTGIDRLSTVNCQLSTVKRFHKFLPQITSLAFLNLVNRQQQ
ncbi:MAG: hypothetical protein ACRC62_32955 [Microcoleus sp.]